MITIDFQHECKISYNYAWAIICYLCYAIQIIICKRKIDSAAISIKNYIT